jgi:hypothetical protein
MTTTIESIAKNVIIFEQDGQIDDNVFDVVCGLTHDEFEAVADLSLDQNGAPSNRAQNLYPNYYDCCNLGEWSNLEAAQDVMQRVRNVAYELHFAE